MTEAIPFLMFCNPEGEKIPVGSGLVWAPIGIIMIIQGTPASIFSGIFLIVYSAIIINVLDSFLRPKLIKSDVNLHPLVTILSVIGGVGLFGVLAATFKEASTDPEL